MMGCMLLFKVRIRLISIFAVLSMVFFTAADAVERHAHPRRGLRVLRRGAETVRRRQTFVKNVVLLPMAFVVWWRYRPDKIFAFKRAGDRAYLSRFFFLAMYLGYYCYIHLPLDRLPAL